MPFPWSDSKAFTHLLYSLYSEYKGEIVQNGIKLSVDNRTQSQSVAS